ncbi:glycosyltransferase family 2 protein [Demetria terragena]|uniref:glycosyltransferase family 2 protein n=1 Tax=Demetria terragena TaxID=63959 RepID=UPI00036CC59E|nr:glycosyltransferase [Demetria terragena]
MTPRTSRQESLIDQQEIARPTFGVVVLTQGTRPAELQRGLESLRVQKGVQLDIVVVGNAWDPVGLPEGVATLALPHNVGIPAGRNAGVDHVNGEFLFFLDDDAWLIDDDFLLNCAQAFRRDPTIGMIQPRIEDPDSVDYPQRWIPRLRKGSRFKSSNVFSVVEMAVALRREVFDATLGWPAPFFYAHEGIELAWRVWGVGSRTVYLGHLRAGHPVIDPRRHADYFTKNARNRVWLARRNLPWPVSWGYVGSWTLVQLIRWRREPENLKPWFAGWFDGWTQQPWAPEEPRRKLSWSTVVRMGRAGRWPLI